MEGGSLGRLIRLDRDFIHMLTVVKVKMSLQRVLVSQCLLRIATARMPMVVMGSGVWQLTISILVLLSLEVGKKERVDMMT